MDYKFPEIKHISDVLPYVQDRKDFVVAERDWYTVINYLVEFPDSFDIDPENPIAGIMRRECRGIIFSNETGELISRPFHKFFNLNQRAETQIRAVDFSKPHRILEKMDGSMIRFIFKKDDPHPYAATKMGLSEVAEQCQEWVDRQSDERIGWLREMHEKGKTAIFEWISPDNLIVVEYDHEDLVLLAVRDNLTGEYEDIHSIDSPFTVVPEYGSIDLSIDEYVERARAQIGREGDIIRFNDGHMLKIKNDHYVKIHKVKDQIRSPRHVFDLMIKNQTDDVISHLDQKDFEKLRKFEVDFWAAFKKKAESIEDMIADAVARTQGDRKRIALEIVPELKDKTLSQFIFGSVTGKRVDDMLMAYVQKHAVADARWDECWQWLTE